MGIVEEGQQANKEMTARTKENFMHQLLATQSIGGRMIEMLKAAAVQTRTCNSTFDISDAVNELIRERKVIIQLIGDEPYLWLDRNR